MAGRAEELAAQIEETFELIERAAAGGLRLLVLLEHAGPRYLQADPEATRTDPAEGRRLFEQMRVIGCNDYASTIRPGAP